MDGVRDHLTPEVETFYFLKTVLHVFLVQLFDGLEFVLFLRSQFQVTDEHVLR